MPTHLKIAYMMLLTTNEKYLRFFEAIFFTAPMESVGALKHWIELYDEYVAGDK
jgi:hypothetical protein